MASLTFSERLTRRAQQADSLLCVGLDPHPSLLGQPGAEAARQLCLRLIEATADQACAFKPNAAFFEAFGEPGWGALRDVIEAVPDGIPVILDAKRGDIASTAEAYARAAFESLGADAVTANPYLGGDTLEPLLRDPRRGVFLLCKTSNPGAGDLQDLIIQPGEPVYLTVAGKALLWGKADNLGLVVGATQPQALRQVRQRAPDAWILSPGVGAQGGDLEAAVNAGLRRDGLGLLISVSRELAQAKEPARLAAELRQAINQARRRQASAESAGQAGRDGLADALLDAGCVKFGSFRLKSGESSPIYIDLRILVSKPRLLAQVAWAYAPLLSPLTFSRLAAVPYAGLPIATAIALQCGYPMVYPRKALKAHGTREPVEGVYNPGETVVLIDDLATTGGSKLEAIERLAQVGLRVEDVVVMIDRRSAGPDALAERGVRLHAVFELPRLIDGWKARGRLDAAAASQVRAYLAG